MMPAIKKLKKNFRPAQLKQNATKTQPKRNQIANQRLATIYFNWENFKSTFLGNVKWKKNNLFEASSHFINHQSIWLGLRTNLRAAQQNNKPQMILMVKKVIYF